MKKIRFDQVGSKGDWAFMGIAIVITGIGYLEPIAVDNPKFYSWVLALGFGLQSVFFIRMMWSRNLVQYNKVGMYIRLNSPIGRSFKYADIQSIAWDDNLLSIKSHSREKVKEYDLRGIDPEYKRALAELVDTVTDAISPGGRLTD